jgi:hypothetical protein
MDLAGTRTADTVAGVTWSTTARSKLGRHGGWRAGRAARWSFALLISAGAGASIEDRDRDTRVIAKRINFGATDEESADEIVIRRDFIKRDYLREAPRVPGTNRAPSGIPSH